MCLLKINFNETSLEFFSNAKGMAVYVGDNVGQLLHQCGPDCEWSRMNPTDFLPLGHILTQWYTYPEKYLNIYITDWHKIWYRYSLFQDDSAYWLWWSPDFPSNATMRWTFIVSSEMSQ